MCGVYGFIGKPTKQTSHTVKILGLLNESRGKDSTGLAVIAGKNTQVIKQAINASKFFNDLHSEKLIGNYKNMQTLTVLGHTRLATHGAVNNNNAHPFKIKNIVFTHNGVISNFTQLQATHKTKYDVDSQIIGHLLAEKDLHKAFENIAGMFTVPFVNTNEPDMLQVAVHNQVFAFAYKGTQLYYSSDIDHLKQALSKQGFTICKAGNDVLYRFYVVGNGIAISKERITANKQVYYSSYDYYSGYGHNYDYYYDRWVNYYNKKYDTAKSTDWKQIKADKPYFTD